jgi:hypothetical protein
VLGIVIVIAIAMVGCGSSSKSATNGPPCGGDFGYAEIANATRSTWSASCAGGDPSIRYVVSAPDGAVTRDQTIALSPEQWKKLLELSDAASLEGEQCSAEQETAHMMFVIKGNAMRRTVCAADENAPELAAYRPLIAELHRLTPSGAPPH